MPPPSMLRGKTIEEIVNRWSTELETQTREFVKFANEVSSWDRALIENSNYVLLFPPSFRYALIVITDFDIARDCA